MNKIATITGKRQITIPIKLFRAANLDKNKKVVISQEKNRLVITSATALVENLAGSLKMPSSWQGKDLEEIIEGSKAQYFSQKNNK